MEICELRIVAATMALAAMLAGGQPAATLAPSDRGFRLGPDDVIAIRALDAEELSDKQIRIGADGYINLPTIGRLKAAGRTVEEVQTEVADRLKRLIVSPDVSVSLVETHSQPVTVVGFVKNPGVIQLQSRKTLVEILSAAGGPRDDAGYSARITRQKEFGVLPLPNATDDSTGQYSIADVNLQAIMDARDPAANIKIMPNDLISVPKAEMVYVIGEVLKPGSIALGDQKILTVLRAISITSGVTKTAKAGKTKILRVVPGSEMRQEITIDLQGMLIGKVSDVRLQADDILYVPNNLKKEIALKTLESLAATGATSLIYRLP